jgi:rRNA pseudouridine-1189 N-methylase Emg1 (Nep1/Mra1 family)
MLLSIVFFVCPTLHATNAGPRGRQDSLEVLVRQSAHLHHQQKLIDELARGEKDVVHQKLATTGEQQAARKAGRRAREEDDKY